MTKSENREMEKLLRWYAMGGADDIVARGLSVLFRSARTEKSRTEILRHVRILDLMHHSEFNIFA
jgi:hypothetical protein